MEPSEWLGTFVDAGSIHRVDPVVAAARYTLDDPRSIPSLVGQGHHSARHALGAVHHLFEHPAEPFLPIRRSTPS